MNGDKYCVGEEKMSDDILAAIPMLAVKGFSYEINRIVDFV
jgi:hypothetical protein